MTAAAAERALGAWEARRTGGEGWGEEGVEWMSKDAVELGVVDRLSESDGARSSGCGKGRGRGWGWGRDKGKGRGKGRGVGAGGRKCRGWNVYDWCCNLGWGTGRGRVNGMEGIKGSMESCSNAFVSEHPPLPRPPLSIPPSLKAEKES